MTTLTTGRRVGWVDEVAGAYRAGRPVALLFDYDGALTPISAHPSLARLPAETRDRLTRLAAVPGVAVGVVSGRALAEVRDCVGLDGLFYVGSGGLEVDLRGRRVGSPGGERFRRAAAPLRDDLDRLLARFPGAWLEDKPAALALHYRGLPPSAAVRFRAETAAVLGRHPAVRHREVAATIEVAPAGGWDKGTAVEVILGRLDPDVLAVYVGGVASDAEAMAVVGLTGGLTVGVGPDAPPLAAHRIASARELGAWLDRLIGEVSPDGPFAEGPLAQPADPEGPAAAAVPEPAGAVPADAPGVLILDSDARFRAEFASALRRLGWRVWAEGEPAEAVRTLRRHVADIRAAVVDLQLPGLQGARVLAELTTHSPDLVRCGMTADVSAYAVAAFQRLSSTTLFAKPFDFGAASATLRWLIGADDRPDPPDDGFPSPRPPGR